MAFMPDHPEKAPSSDDAKPNGCGSWAVDGAIVLAVVIILGVFWLMLMESGVKKMAKHSQCGKNQSQIFGATIAYATAEETAWPDPRGTTMAAWKIPAGPIKTALEGAQYTAGAFELVAASQSVPNSLFRCPSASFGGPSRNVKPSLNFNTVQWGWEPAVGVAVSYAFDWASPPDPSSARVVLADREEPAHRDFVVVTFGDAHVKKVKLVEVVRGTGVLVTESGVSASRKTGTAVQPGDDIYTPEGDGGDPLTPGKGDPMRAWVK